MVNKSLFPLKTITYRESLPTGCPNLRKCSKDTFEVMRLAKKAKPDQACFDSHAARKLPLGDNDACSWSSCSMVIAGRPGIRTYAASLKLLPKFKKYYSHVFFLTTSTKMGHYDKTSSHSNVWFFSDFDPVASINKVVPL